MLSFFNRVRFLGALCLAVVAAILFQPCPAHAAECSRCGSGDCDYEVGINLAGAEFAGGQIPGVERQHFIWPAEDNIRYWHEQGVRLVRLPFKWERLQTELMGDFAPEYRDGLVRSVRLMHKYDMLVVPDVHSYARYRGNDIRGNIGSEQVPYEAFGDLWRRLALLLKDEPNIWGYGLMNEPHLAGGGGVDWGLAAQVAIDAIREVDRQTMILVANDYSAWAATYQRGDLADWAESSMMIGDPSTVNDPSDNLRYELHVYFDHDNSGLYRHSYEADVNRGSRVSPTVGVERLRPFVAWLERHGVKGFVGEFGCPANPGADPRWLTVLDNTLEYMREHCLPNTIWAAGGWWTPGTPYVIEPRGWSRDLPDEFRQQRRPQTLLLQRYMEPPRLDREGERQLEDYFERFEIRSAPAETADGFALADAFENYGIRNTSIFHLTDNWHRTWAGDSQFYPQRDPETLRNVLRTPPDQWGHEVFYRNPGRFSIPAEAEAATLHFKIKIPEQAGHDVTLGPAFNVSGGGASKVEEKFAAAIKVRAGHIDYFNPAATENQWPRAVDSASIGSWHGVWLVIDNVGGTYDLYIDPGATREAVDSDQLVAERIALNHSGETMDHFLLTTHGKGVVFLTDIYFDAVQKNLNQPNPIR